MVSVYRGDTEGAEISFLEASMNLREANGSGAFRRERPAEASTPGPEE